LTSKLPSMIQPCILVHCVHIYWVRHEMCMCKNAKVLYHCLVNLWRLYWERSLFLRKAGMI
jgi:hypothetical protein